MKHFYLGLISILLLSSCSKQSEQTIKVTGDSASLATEIATVTTRLTHTRDTALVGADTTSIFGIRDTVHALVKTQNAHDGSNIYGKWFYLETGQLIAQNSAPLLTGTNFSHFDLFDSLPWHPGKYELLVFLDRDVKDSVKFSIVDKR